MAINILERMNKYDKEHCWQYDIRVNNKKEDLLWCGINEGDLENINVNEFVFSQVDDKNKRIEMTKFIKRHEWLGNLSQFTTHWFGAYYKGELGGVILMNMPNAFSKVLGEDTKKLERLVSRGACISWSPKNLASKFLMWSIKWMVNNTRYRVFSAYSDPTAKEIGTIYQACNWIYLGNTFGTNKRYINPYNGKLMTDRTFRTRSFYKRYAKDLGIDWVSNWSDDNKMNWDNIPDDIEKKLRHRSKELQKNAKYHTFPNKHKYIYILGRGKKETKSLKKIFYKNHKTKSYPKDRGK